MTYEVSDMINDCIDNAPEVDIQFPANTSELREVDMIYKKPIGPLYAVARYGCQKNKPLKITKYFIYGYDALNEKDRIVWEWLPSTNFSVVRDGFKNGETAMAALASIKKEMI